MWKLKYRDADGVHVKETIGRVRRSKAKAAEAAPAGRLCRYISDFGLRKNEPRLSPPKADRGL